MARPTRNIGNENVDNEAVDLEGGELMEAPEESVETQLVEVDRGNEGEVVDAIDGDQLDNDVDQLVDHAENVESSLDEGGMDPVAARATEIAVEDICNRWNFKRKTVGVENYASGSSRMSATRLGLESIIDAAKQGFQAIIEWIKRRIVQIKDIWRKYVNVGKSIKARAAKLRARVAKLEGAPDADEKVEGSKVWQLASAVDAKMAFTNIRSIKPDNADALLTTITGAMTVSLNDSEKTVTADIADEAALPQLEGKPIGAVGKITWEVNGNAAKVKRHFPSGATNPKVIATYGGLIIYYTMTVTAAASGTAAVTTSHVKWVPAQLEDAADIELPSLTTDAMDDMLDTATAIGANLEDYIRKFSKVEASFDKLKRSLDKLQSKSDKASNKKTVQAADIKKNRGGIKIAKASFENAQELDKIYREIGRSCALGMMAYVQASFKAYNNNDD